MLSDWVVKKILSSMEYLSLQINKIMTVNKGLNTTLFNENKVKGNIGKMSKWFDN